MFVLVAVGLVVTAVGVMLIVRRRAPEGYQDASGFHLGKKEPIAEPKKPE